MNTTPRQEARFWDRVDRSAGPDACWAWTGVVDRHGYGEVKVNGRKWRAHRLAVTLAGAEIPTGSVVMHTCDNPPCVNPAHLAIGTVRENNVDMHSKGRWSRWRRGCLTREQVAEIRLRYLRGEGSPTLGRAFGIHQTTAYNAATGRTFTHLPMPSKELA